MSFLEVTNLCAGYGSKPILEDICFRVEENSVVGLLGANGCGKTTALKALCGILPGKGTRRLEGNDLAGLSPRRMAQVSRYIPQRSGIALDISALDVVLMGFNPVLGLLELPNAAQKEQARQVLAQVGMADRADANFQTLSEGQKQLVILARTLLLERGILFLDEPESALDFGCRYRILELVRSWADAPGRAAVVTLHDPQLALNCCDTLILMQSGRILAELHPADDPEELLEAELSKIYGPLSVRRCTTRKGKQQLVLLKEEPWRP